MKPQTQSNNSRIAKNTLYMYFRSMFTMLVSIYSSRVILNTLGVEDYGIYNIVGGVVSMFTIISATFTSSTQRFITFELGKKDKQRTSEVFSSSLIIHLILAISILLIIEFVGVWFLNNKLIIPENRLNAANWVFQFSIISFAIQLLNIPFRATILANEKMKAFAMIDMLQAVLKLLILYLIVFISFDKLILYAGLILVLTLLITFIYIYYCKKNFPECNFTRVKNRQIYKEILGFSGWNFIGTSSSVLTTQGLNILINLFWGVRVNAARGIAMQVENAVRQLVDNFMLSLNPQITKSYSGNDLDYMLMLVEKGARFSFYLMFLLSIPIIFETETILSIWLKMVPEYAVIFVRLSIIFTLSQTFSNTLVTAMMASGKIKSYQITIGIFQILNFPISYYFLKIGLPPYIIYIVTIINNIICIFLRILFVQKTLKVSMKKYVDNVIFKSFSISILSSIIPLVIVLNFPESFIRLISTSLLGIIVFGMLIFILGIDKSEKTFITDKIIHKFLK